MNRIIHIILLAAFLVGNVRAQDLNKLGTEDAFSVHGGINLNTITYYTDDSIARRQPFTWNMNANLVLDFIGISAPFTYSYSNQGGVFTQPTLMASIHPTYKDFTAHLGITSMQFSQYTLANHLFAGGGLDYKPKNWELSVMGGRMNKAIQYDGLIGNPDLIAYQRYGYGAKTGYTKNNSSVAIMFFKAKDEASSLDFVPLNSQVLPEDNFTLGITGKTKIKKNWSLQGEFAGSALTGNMRDLNPYTSRHGLSFMRAMVRDNASTHFYAADNTSVNYQMKFMSVALKFEHVDPGYKTLGAYFFNHDLQNYTLAPSFNLLKGKLNLASNFGFQRNNLGGDKGATTKRWVGSLNANAMLLKGLVINANYSNFSAFTNNRPLNDPFYYQAADTLNYYQINQNAGMAIMYSMEGKRVRKSIALTGQYSESLNLNGEINAAGAYGFGVDFNPDLSTQVYVANIAFNNQIVASKTNIAITANANVSDTPINTSLFIGPGIQFGKPIAKEKIKLGLGSVYNRQYTDDVLQNNVLNNRLSMSYAAKVKEGKAGNFSLSLSANHLLKLPTISTQKKVNEINVFLNLGYRI